MEDLREYINIRRREKSPYSVQSRQRYPMPVATPQYLPVPGAGQTMNSAGGFVWQISPWERLERFLILGSESGTYYVAPLVLTAENAEAAQQCIREDGLRVVERVVAVSDAGQAASNDPALFVLAMAAGLGDEATRRAALAALPKVARIGTHLFHFLHFVDGFRGWGRALRNAVAAWYTAMEPGRLAYQAVKYQQRDGWSHRDALRLAHPRPTTASHDAIFGWIVKEGWAHVGAEQPADDALTLLWVYEQARRATDEATVLALIERHRLTWEFVPSHFLGSAQVWQALLPNLPLTALLRNLGRMTANGALKPMSAEVESVAARLTDAESIQRSRLHPLAVLMALKTYAEGRGVRGSLSWKPVEPVVEALDRAFYLAFDNVTPTGKRIMLALDVSGSMSVPVMGLPGLSARDASAALALVTERVETNIVITAFAAGSARRRRHHDSGITLFPISPDERLDEVVQRMVAMPFGGTDCALPMLHALEQKLEIDAFVIYTDSETWAGQIHPAQALRQYREQMGIDARLVVVGMTSNGFSIADPNDPAMLDVVGMSTSTPDLINQFIAA